MTKIEYREYLASPHWQETRKEFLGGVDGCNRCELPRWLANIAYDQDLHVHHISYAHLGREDEYPEDLEPLCKRCHELETFKHTNLQPVRSIKCSICASPAYNIFPIYDQPLCFVCDALCDHIGYRCELKDPSRADAPVWKGIVSAIARRVGVDAVLEKLAQVEKWLRERALARAFEEFPF